MGATIVYADQDASWRGGCCAGEDLRPFIAAAKAAHPGTFSDVELSGDSHIFAQISRADAAAEVDLATPEALDQRLVETLVAWLAAH